MIDLSISFILLTHTHRICVLIIHYSTKNDTPDRAVNVTEQCDG